MSLSVMVSNSWLLLDSDIGPMMRWGPCWRPCFCSWPCSPQPPPPPTPCTNNQKLQAFPAQVFLIMWTEMSERTTTLIMIIIIVSGGDAFGGLQQQEIPPSVKLRHKGGIVLAVTYIKNYKNIHSWKKIHPWNTFFPEIYSPLKNIHPKKNALYLSSQDVMSMSHNFYLGLTRWDLETEAEVGWTSWSESLS